MKKIAVMLFVALAIVSCKKKETVKTTTPEEENVTQTTNMAGDAVMVNTENSYVWYKGSKPAGSHDGKVMMKDGKFMVKDGKLMGGEFTIDMTSISNDDLPENKKADLVGHLKNPDFFDVETYPTAKFKILTVDTSEEEGMMDLKGSMTIKDVTMILTVPAKVTMDGDNVSMESSFNINRKDFNIGYDGSKNIVENLKDAAIADAIELKVVAKS